jgi:cobalt-zinc-cadmium efflux system membrane fusion protein
MRLALLLAAALPACGQPEAPEPAPAKATAAAPAGAMCAEHGVLEAVCTKCNPKLAPVFQAKGDWCGEHGFPESICPLCHPERNGRPQAEVSNEEAPPDGTKVRLRSKETERLAGLRTAKAEERPGGARLAALATIAYDATRRAEVNARAAGVVRAIEADVGDRVEPGATLASVESADVGADQSRLRAAAERVRVARADYDRNEQLHRSGVSSQREVLAARQELEAARSEHAALRSALGMVGSSGGGRYAVTAPLGGTVIRRTVTVGQLVEAGAPLFEVADTSTMWARIEVPEPDIGEVAVGQSVTLALDALRGRTFEGRVASIATEVDSHTRTVAVRASIPNPDGVLRANMFANARIALGGTRPTVMVPRAAVQRAKGVPLVFVRTGDGEYEARRVKLGLAEADAVEVVEGVKPGEDVATDGSFLLKTETLKGSIGAGCCEAD